MSACQHTEADQDTAIVDGLCPLCLAEENAALKTALVALREWLWSGKMDPNQKPGAPICAPRDVSEKFSIAAEYLPDGGAA